MNQPLHPDDLKKVRDALPGEVNEALFKNNGKLFLAGGFIRAIVAGEAPNDIDLFGKSPTWLDDIAEGFSSDTKIPRWSRSVSNNAITMKRNGIITPVQFTTRWTYSEPEEIINGFDYSVCRAVVWVDSDKMWQGLVDEDFYHDLLSKRLRWKNPHSANDSAGSMLRALKFMKRGYSIDMPNFAAVTARFITTLDGMDVDEDSIREEVELEFGVAYVDDQ